MDMNVARALSFPESDVEPHIEPPINDSLLEKPPDFPGTKCGRPETPSSDASTSGVCSLASSDFESSEENLDEKPKGECCDDDDDDDEDNNNDDVGEEGDDVAEEGDEDEEKYISDPVIIYEKRDVLNVFENIYPYSVFQTTSVPKMNMSNYWERRSVYHRLGPYGQQDEFDFHRCYYCDFYSAVPKRL